MTYIAPATQTPCQHGGAPWPIISRGRHAGQPRPITDIVVDALFDAKEIALKLKRQGAALIGIDIGNGLPTLQILPGPITRELIENGHAACSKRQCGRSGEQAYYWFAQTWTDDGHEVRLEWIDHVRR